MRTVNFQGNAMPLKGNIPEVGHRAPDFILTAQDLSDIKLEDLRGKRIVLNIFPSLDTDVCAASVRKFNSEASKYANTVVICVSMDLPFAATRFCTVNGIENVITGSGFRSDFGEKYGMAFADGPLRDLYSRGIIVIDEAGKIIGISICEEVTNEPDYEYVKDILK